MVVPGKDSRKMRKKVGPDEVEAGVKELPVDQVSSDVEAEAVVSGGQEDISMDLLKAVKVYPQVESVHASWLHRLSNIINFVPRYIENLESQVPEMRGKIEALFEDSFPDMDLFQVAAQMKGEENIATLMAKNFGVIESDIKNLVVFVRKARVFSVVLYDIVRWFSFEPSERTRELAIHRDAVIALIDSLNGPSIEGFDNSFCQRAKEVLVVLDEILDLKGDNLGEIDEVKLLASVNAIDSAMLAGMEDMSECLAEKHLMIKRLIDEMYEGLSQEFGDDEDGQKFVSIVFNLVRKRVDELGSALGECKEIAEKVVAVEEEAESEIGLELGKYFEGLNDARGVKVNVSENFPGGIEVPIGQQKFGLLVGNLIDNAKKAMKPDGEIEIDIFVSFSAGEVTVEVVDSGVGIPDDVKRQLNDGENVSTSGGGKGMIDIRDVLSQLKGTIHFESEIGARTVVRVKFPVSVK